MIRSFACLQQQNVNVAFQYSKILYTHGNPAAFGLDFFLEISHDLDIDPERGYRLCANPVQQ